ncbi:MAG: outer membrane protein assembly factor, partial [Ferruginibacter sp.]|nr:outer membrane protein assembly factor [Chitinophagaceae bacterium]
MQRFLLRLSVTVMTVLVSVFTLQAQVVDTTNPTSLDPKLLEWKNARVPKEYIIADVKITGIKHLDTSIVYSIANLQPGDKFIYPGTDIFAKSIAALWRQKFFSGAQVYVTRIEDNKVWLEVGLVERPRLGNFKFVGIKKSDEEEILGKVNLAKQTIITENTRREIVEKITKFYTEKAFQNVTVRIEEKPDTSFVNSNAMIIYVDKGEKVHIDNIRFYGNNSIDGLRLKKQMKGTKEMSKVTLDADNTASPYGTSKTFSFNEYVKEWGFLSLSKTKRLLDPYFRFKLSGAKFNQLKFEEDKNSVLNYYNSMGYRDAQIVSDTTVGTRAGNIHVDLKVDEGRKYYFGNITWKGNAKYSDSIMNVILGINKGDIYNIDILNKRLGKEVTQEGGDISGLYMDDGYLFFRVEPVETAVYNDTIDHEIRITEGPQARIKNVTIAGNEKTKDHVIRRELR